MEDKSLAWEMLEENKRNNKRLFVMAIVELVIIVSMIASFFIYESQFDYVTSMEQTQENITSSSASQTIN